MAFGSKSIPRSATRITVLGTLWTHNGRKCHGIPICPAYARSSFIQSRVINPIAFNFYNSQPTSHKI